MRTALQMLGYSEIYHMQSVLGNPLEAAMWQEAMDAKFLGKGKKYGRAEWDQLLGHCQVRMRIRPTWIFCLADSVR
jgi:hypothetical protein